eukprot:2870861-Rhodomonas_salina.1
MLSASGAEESPLQFAKLAEYGVCFLPGQSPQSHVFGCGCGARGYVMWRSRSLKLEFPVFLQSGAT